MEEVQVLQTTGIFSKRFNSQLKSPRGTGGGGRPRPSGAPWLSLPGRPLSVLNSAGLEFSSDGPGAQTSAPSTLPRRLLKNKGFSPPG